MKKLIHILFFVVTAYSLFGQAPQKMSYQAVIRNSSNTLVANQSVGIRVTILKGASSGTEVYKEIYNPNPRTNANGLVSIEIGAGISVTGTFASIDWANGPYFIKTETDPNGGTDYTITSTAQLLSVPYAMYAANSGSSLPGPTGPKGEKGETGATGPQGNGFSNGTANNQIMYWNGAAWVTLNPGQKGQSLTICDGGLTWATGGICPLTDASGNTYSVVVVGSQTWMAENLRTTKYRNGEDIQNLTDNSTWSINSTGAWSYYDNNAANDSIYGKIYNWYAVNNANQLCPIGWHVPTDADWTTLTNFLGGETSAGGKMKSTGTQYWLSPNTDATNSSGWSGLPGGRRFNNGVFDLVGFGGQWWSFTEYNELSGTSYALYYDQASFTKADYFKENGFYVRCMKD